MLSHATLHQLLHFNSALTGDELLAVLVQLQVGDNKVRCGQVQWDALAALLLTDKLFDLHGKLKAVNLTDLTFMALVRATSHLHSVISSDRKATDLVLLPELLRQRCRHDNTAHMGRGLEVSLP